MDPTKKRHAWVLQHPEGQPHGLPGDEMNKDLREKDVGWTFIVEIQGIFPPLQGAQPLQNAMVYFFSRN